MGAGGRIACGALAVTLATSGALAGPGRLVVELDRPGHRISPTLWGVFFEEINCSGDGGLYAELVRNRSFEDSEQPDHWSLVCRGRSRGSMAVDRARPLSEANPRSLRIRLEPGEGGAVGVANDGWWGICVREGATYDLSFYARGADGFAGPVRAALENAAGAVHGEAVVPSVSDRWRRYRVELVSRATDPRARLVITADRPGTLWLDVVSLFPRETWKGRANGLRADLARMLDELRPAFVRFPGGCWVEGDTMATAYRWKRTIGELGDRSTQWNLWGYHSTNGLGFHEYLQLCEDLKAEPLFVVNCGMSHKENVPMDRMAEFVQDALDAIEYANGPATSRWGALRAKAGHPEPFGLRYLQIGNENGGPAYDERYALFYDAVKAAHPEVKLVACVWNGVPKSRPLEIVDEHYYDTPEFFVANAGKYDAYDRRGPKVYVGEYAVTRGAGQGNLRAALAEAAFMTGIERNSDVVVMASYAPLFVNVNHRRWNPDLIAFDSSRACGTPSYHVQKMFGRNRGDVILPVEVQPQPLPRERLDENFRATLRGSVGVGTWRTQAEFRDIRVTSAGRTLFEGSAPAAEWRFGKGSWRAEAGTLGQTSMDIDCRATVGDAAWTDYTYELKARKIGGQEGFLIIFRFRDDDHFIWWNIGGWGNSRTALELFPRAENQPLGGTAPVIVEAGRWYDIRIEVEGPRIRCLLDGALVTEATLTPAPAHPFLHATASREDATGDVILKVVNVSDAPQLLRVQLRGARGLAPSARAEVLTGDPDEENSLDAPARVSPVTETLRLAGEVVEHTFPANSLTVIRFGRR